MRAAFHFLFIEDQDTEIDLISQALQGAGFQLEFEKVQTAFELTQALEKRSWDLILSDSQLPHLRAQEALKITQKFSPETPFLLVSDSLPEETLVELMREGARDFISKSDLARLVPVITRELAELDRSRSLTADEQAEAEITESHRKMVEGVRDLGMIFLDAQGQVTGWNPGARRIFGYAENEIKGQSSNVLFTDEDQRQDAYRREMTKAQADGQIEDERWYRRKNGSKFWGHGLMTALMNDDGSLRGFSKILRDSTNKKLAMEQVEEARKRAESANKAKTQFLANMSHEIRTPLGIMMGFAELMTEPDHNAEELKSFAETILKNGQQLSRMINDVLDMSKVEANKLETEKSDFSLSEFLADVLAMLRMQAEEKGLELVVTTEGPVPRRIFSDPARLRQILMNLVGNSLKFTDAGMVELRVRSVSSPQTHSSMILEFEVKDTGQGIAAENVSKLFQPFTSGDSSGARRFGGTGLGLYLAKRLAQALGGDLILRETSENRGSTFVFTVDAGPFETDVKFYTERSSINDQASEKALSGVRILVVDDSPDNRLLVRRLLENANADVDTADNGLSAVEKAKEGSFDLILMDIQMPVMDGYEAFAQIRQQGFTRPIVALTAHALHSEREHCFSLGFDDHLSKPIDRKVLVETITRLTQKEHHGRPHLVALRPSIH